MHVESVAWISERKDVLSTPLLLGAMFAYWRYCAFQREDASDSMRDRPGGAARRLVAYIVMLILFILSLMTKAMGVTLPLLLLLLDYWPLRRKRPLRSLLLEKIPVAIIAILFSVIAIREQQAGGATSAAVELSMVDRINNAIVCYVIYLVKLAFPTDLAAFYPHPGFRPTGAVIASAGLLTLITWLGFRQRRRAPYFLVGWLWFVIALIPIIGLVQIGGQAMADRYSYLPSIGLCIAAVWGIAELMPKPKWSAALGLAVVGTLCVAARRQAWYWKDTETLFQHSYDVTGPNPVASFVLGTAAYSRSDLPGAVKHLTYVVEHDARNDRALKILGDIWSAGDLDKAIDYYGQAVTVKPMNTEYRLQLAAALTRRGDLASLESAEQQLRQLLRIDPNDERARAGLADVQSRERSKAR